jgi:hypothetical protein
MPVQQARYTSACNISNELTRNVVAVCPYHFLQRFEEVRLLLSGYSSVVLDLSDFRIINAIDSHLDARDCGIFFVHATRITY